MNNVVFLSLGSNLGDTHKNINTALSHLYPHIKDAVLSSLYETEPVGNKEQPWFLNCVLIGMTGLSAYELLAACKKIEKKLGRAIDDSGSSSKPRIIDIDILFYGNDIMKTPELTIPHPRVHERKFVLVPLAEIAPDFVHPKVEKTIRELLNECADRSIVRLSA